MAMDEIAISVKNVSKHFLLPHEKVSSLKGLFTGIFKLKGARTIERQQALDSISFEVKKGEFFGVVGRNGSGKSTLLKILAGIYQPNEGKINIKGKLVPFIELGVGFNPELTGRENVYLNGALLGFTTKEIDQQYKQIVEFAELEKFMDQKLKNYSSGMQVRLAFSVATTAKADILLVDEVLAVGDADFQRKCFDYFQKLKGSGTTVVFVTHDMNAVREYCERAVLIEKSKLVASGAADKVASEYTKMFMGSTKKSSSKESGVRWGDGAIKYKDVKISEPILKGKNELHVSLTAVAYEEVKNPVFGFLIKNAAKTHILGTNTIIEKKSIGNLQKGQEILIEWSIPNIFNDGIHYFDPAIVYKGTTQVADWWEEAASFTVLREQKTPYIISPSLSIRINGSE